MFCLGGFIIFIAPVYAFGFPDWTVDTVPDSQTNAELCGVDLPGFVCDPNKLLNPVNETTPGAQLVENDLSNIRMNTNCSCSEKDVLLGECPETGSYGYTVSVVIIQSMRMNPGENDEKSRTEAIKKFADALRSRFARARCEDDALIAISVHENAVWTSVGNVTDRVLKKSLINSITLRAGSFFAKSDYTGGLHYMLQMYLKALRGEKIEFSSRSSWYSSLPLWAMILLGVFIAIIIVCLIALFIRLCCFHQARGYTVGRRTYSNTLK